MEKGNLTRWLKAEGDTVKPGDVIAEIETDKATMEVEAVDEGTLGKILVPAGTNDVPVNDVIALIAEEGEDPKTLTAAPPAAQAASAAPAPPRHRPRSAPTAAPSAAPGNVVAFPPPAGEKPARRFASPLARRLASQNKLDLARDHRQRPAWPHHRRRCDSRAWQQARRKSRRGAFAEADAIRRHHQAIFRARLFRRSAA